MKYRKCYAFVYGCVCVCVGGWYLCMFYVDRFATFRPGLPIRVAAGAVAASIAAIVAATAAAASTATVYGWANSQFVSKRPSINTPELRLGSIFDQPLPPLFAYSRTWPATTAAATSAAIAIRFVGRLRAVLEIRRWHRKVGHIAVVAAAAAATVSTAASAAAIVWVFYIQDKETKYISMKERTVVIVFVCWQNRGYRFARNCDAGVDAAYFHLGGRYLQAQQFVPTSRRSITTLGGSHLRSDMLLVLVRFRCGIWVYRKTRYGFIGGRARLVDLCEVFVCTPNKMARTTGYLVKCTKNNALKL